MSGPGHWFIDSLFLLLPPSTSFIHATTSSFASPPGVRQHWRCFVASLAAQVRHKNVWGSITDLFDRDFFGTLPDTKEADVAFILDDFPNLTSVPWLPSLPKSFPSRVWRHVQPQPLFMDPWYPVVIRRGPASFCAAEWWMWWFFWFYGPPPHCYSKAEFLEIILVSHDMDCYIQGLKARWNRWQMPLAWAQGGGAEYPCHYTSRYIHNPE